MEAREVTYSPPTQVVTVGIRGMCQLGEMGWTYLGPYGVDRYRMESPKEVREFDLIPGRKYLKVAEWLGSRENGQRTIRWFKDMTTDTWYGGESWNRPNLRQQLSAKSAAYIEEMLQES